MLIILIILVIIGLILFFSYLLFFQMKIKTLEDKLNNLFKKRNYQVVMIYSISNNFLVKHDEIFQEFLELKKRDFSENSFNLGLEGKLPIYKKLHNEINFLFKVCEKHQELNKNPIYNYSKDSIIDKSQEIGKYYNLYKEVNKKFHKIHSISKFLLIGFFIKNT